MLFGLLFLGICGLAVQGFMPAGKENFLSDALLREVVERMSRDLASASDSYLDNTDVRYLSGSNMEAGDTIYPMDLEDLSPPSLRDREFLQHSSLWSSPLDGPASGRQGGSGVPQQQIKTDPSLPAYCNPPNPCPIGYSADDGCLEDFENTAAFSRTFQAAQECMCDTEHMFDCQARDYDNNDLLEESLLDQISHKSLVAKKFHAKKSSNPYLEGEKLPIAAKKGHQVSTN